MSLTIDNGVAGSITGLATFFGLDYFYGYSHPSDELSVNGKKGIN